MIAALNPVLRGWTNYYRHVSAKRTFGYLDYYVWWRVGRWLRMKHPGLNWKQINRRYVNDDHTYQAGGITLYKPASTRVTRYRYRGALIPTPWTPRQPNSLAGEQNAPTTRNSYRSNTSNRRSDEPDHHSTYSWRAGCGETRTSGSVGGGEETTGRKAAPAPRRRPSSPGDASEAAALVCAIQEFVANG